MKKQFQEYHQFTEEEFKELWSQCIFVFDTNTLLNMYRYSRKTVESYLEVLSQLKKKSQLWIPYQVGYEFYENRIDVIVEYESSYDSMLLILEKAKKDIVTKYKNHPFLDLIDIKKKMEDGLSSVEKELKKAKEQHPKWMDKDEVMEKLNDLFEGNIGSNYDGEKLKAIRHEGKERYEKKVPPGYKDDKKTEDKKYGDLILWFQIIDKAKETKKPIILISGDIKEDWWLEKNGNRVMPLPQLKKEMLDKASVDFHIYTADRFLEYYIQEVTGTIDKTAISEVRKIREIEERRMRQKRIDLSDHEGRYNYDLGILEHYTIECFEHLQVMEELIQRLHQDGVPRKHIVELERLLLSANKARNIIQHSNADQNTIISFYEILREIVYTVERLSHFIEIRSEITYKFREISERISHLYKRINRHL